MVDTNWSVKTLLRVQTKSVLSLGSVTLKIRLQGKVISRTFRLFETFIVKMACLTVKDIEAALNLHVSVRDWETLTESIQIPEVMVLMAYARLTELTLQEIEVRFIFHFLVMASHSI